MSLLFRIVYAAHANGTHHKLALDGLRGLGGPDAEAWTRVFLKHAERFMVGSKAPDDTFKDFKNHVLHVGDNYWGGAPEKVAEWYDKTREALEQQNWDEAVYAAGVLSHYYTDPIHPFHTGQTEAENAIHRAAEWSINRSYNDLRALGEERFAALAVPLRDGDGWLKAMVCDGAEFSHRQYEKLIAHYDITRGVSDPPSGLDSVARGVVAELLIYAAKGFGIVLQRVIAEANVQPPEVSLTLDTIKAAIKIPAKALAKRMSNAEDRAVVEAMYDELKATGKVERTLPEDDRVVRDLHALEVVAPRNAKLAAARTARIVGGDAVVSPASTAKPIAAAKPVTSVKKLDAVERPPVTGSAPLEPVVAAEDTMRAAALSLPQAPVAQQPPTSSHAPAAVKPLPLGASATSVPSITPPTSLAARLSSIEPPMSAVPQRAELPKAPVRHYLTSGDRIEAAPSIGPRMAERLEALGLVTVADLLAADPAKTAARLADRRISAETIDDWQCQSAMMLEIPGLRGTHAQLLTAAGCRTASAVAAADAATLSAAILRYCSTSDGRRLLREGQPPDLERIKNWIEGAREAQAA